MFKFINTLGKLVVKMYFREAKRLNDKARKDAAQAQRLAKQARLLSEDAAQAQRLAKQARLLSEDAAQAQRLAKQARLLSEDASAGVMSAAKIAAKATDLNKFFL